MIATYDDFSQSHFLFLCSDYPKRMCALQKCKCKDTETLLCTLYAYSKHILF